jgi:peptide/nickel transport system ATP-binding protein
VAQRNILEVQDLNVKFYTYAGVVEALDGVNLFIRKGEILGLVGETGSGKSVTSLSMLMLVPPPGKIESGRILIGDASKQQDVLLMDDGSLRKMRGNDISMIFQEPRAYLNPVYSVLDQISEVILVHRKEEFLERSIASLQKNLMGKRKHQLSAQARQKLEKKRSQTEERIARLEKRRIDMEQQRAELEKQKDTEKQRAKLAGQQAKLVEQQAKLAARKADVEEQIAGVPSNLEVKGYKRMLRARSRGSRLTARLYSRLSRKRQFKAEVRKEVERVLKSVEISDPQRVASMYPHELSGGMAQRVVIGMALSCNPTMLIADEPTTNLDVTVQAQILNLIKTLKKDMGSAILYITHDLGVVAQSCDRVAVMYAGSIVETADVFEIFGTPLHPYTRALLESIPRPGVSFKSIPGVVPSLINPLKGCRFHDRCPFAMEACRVAKPAFIEIKADHYVSCHLYGGSK